MTLALRFWLVLTLMSAIAAGNLLAVSLWLRFGSLWVAVAVPMALFAVTMECMVPLAASAAKPRLRQQPKSPEDEKWERLLRVRE